MNSNDIFQLIENIAETPGKNDKTALVALHGADPEFRRVLVAALDPLISYGVKKFLPTTISADQVFNEITWLMIHRLEKRELTGYAALAEIKQEMERLSEHSAELFSRILLKDLRAGFESSTTNKAIKGLIREFPYMRCSLPKKMKLDHSFGWAEGVISQEKADGMFMNLDLTLDGEVMLRSRQGTEYPITPFEAFAVSIRLTMTPGTQTHGEMVVVRDGIVLAREIGNGILNHIESGGDFGEGEAPLFLAWDQIPLTAVVPKGKYTEPYELRLKNLIRQFLEHPTSYIKLIPTKVVYSMKEAWAHYRELLQLGKEGTVFKKPTAIWKDGTSPEQGKLKLEAPFELRVKGFNEGTGKYVGQLGSLICTSECGQLEVNISGRGDAMRAEVWANKDNWLESIITAKGNLIMEPSKEGDKHSIFLPIFLERRADKTQADTLGQIREQFEAAIAAA